MTRALNPLVRLVLLLALASLVVTAVGLAVGPQLGDLATAAHGEADDVELRGLSERSYVYAADGTLIATLREEENRAPVSIDELPQHVIDAVLAVEDADFYDHKGVNVRSTMRALLSNVESGETSQGGSTITQQLVKQGVLTSEQTFDRKLREVFLAVRLEKQMPKKQILELYLNTIYLGNHSYGIQAAAETYFGVRASELDIGQAALLAGLIRDPIDYNPFRYPEVAQERRRIALNRMVAEGKITEEQAAPHRDAPLPTEPIQYTPPPDDYFVEEVKQELLRDPRLGETASERYDAVFRGGLQIYTTLHPALQYLHQIKRNEVLAPFALPENPALFVAGRNMAGQDAIGTVAMATVEPGTGAVRALVGGPGFGDENKFNLATQGYRQPGSSFKTFVLLELLEQGYSPLDTISGAGPCRFKIPGVEEIYEVENFGRSRGFTGSIRSMTTASSNCGYVRLGQIAGIPEVTELAGRMGIKTRNAANEIVDLDPSIFSTPLGTQEVTPLGMAAAYAAIANDGHYNAPYFVERVLDRDGEVILQHSDPGERVVSIETAQIAADILKDNVLGGTGTAARVPGHDVAGKTGTAQDFSNAWFVGFSRQLSTAIWMGAMEGNVPMERVGGRNVTGGSYPAQMFGRIYNAVLENMEPEPFADPPDRRATGSLRVDREIDVGGGSSSYVPRRRRSSSPTRSRAPATTAAPDTTTAPEPSDGGGGGDTGGGDGGGNGNGNGGGGGGGTTGDTTPSGDFEEMSG
ncbi:MAG TPA: transglycosylase domain-containing protein [Acidimicrobiales bacterium]|nr:transglycosylase domain-containing protein [Acidimicrobiales bacterium]